MSLFHARSASIGLLLGFQLGFVLDCAMILRAWSRIVRWRQTSSVYLAQLDGMKCWQATRGLTDRRDSCNHSLSQLDRLKCWQLRERQSETRGDTDRRDPCNQDRRQNETLGRKFSLSQLGRMKCWQAHNRQTATCERTDKQTATPNDPS